MPNSNNILYRPDIDGLRTLAVLLVVFFHTDLTIFSGGFVGVDVFFVISGYLITSIIIRDIEANQFSLLNFYTRRFKRILPALFTVIAFTVFGANLFYSTDALKDLYQSIIATGLFSTNILFNLESGYFSTPAEYKALLHTWSLSIEEQFYILLPFLLLTLNKNKSLTKRLIFLIATISLLLNIFLIEKYPEFTFYQLPTRAWELLIGSLIAINHFKIKSLFFSEIANYLGLALIIISSTAFDKSTPFPGLYALMPVVGAALIIIPKAPNPQLLSYKILSNKPIVFIGLMSYSIYLWHWPITVFIKQLVPQGLSLRHIIFIYLSTLILSYLTWKLIEVPFRKNSIISNNKVIPASMASIALLICTSALLYKQINHNNYINDPEWENWKNCEKTPSDKFCSIGDTGKKTFILWGDSHATAIASGINQAAKQKNASGFLANKSGCPPLIGLTRNNKTKNCKEHNQIVLEKIIHSKSITNVILLARWPLSYTGQRYKNEKGKEIQLLDPKNPREYRNSELMKNSLERTIQRLQDAKKKITIINSIPEIGYEIEGANRVAILTNRDLNKEISPTTKERKERNQGVDDLLKDLQIKYKINIINPSDKLCIADLCIVKNEGKLLYRDDDHLSTYGSIFLSDQLLEIF